MSSQTNEQALEAAIEKHLTGISQEELKKSGRSFNNVEDRAELYRAGKGYYIGAPADYNAKLAIDEVRF